MTIRDVFVIPGWWRLKTVLEVILINQSLPSPPVPVRKIQLLRIQSVIKRKRLKREKRNHHLPLKANKGSQRRKLMHNRQLMISKRPLNNSKPRLNRKIALLKTKLQSLKNLQNLLKMPQIKQKILSMENQVPLLIWRPQLRHLQLFLCRFISEGSLNHLHVRSNLP